MRVMPAALVAPLSEMMLRAKVALAPAAERLRVGTPASRFASFCGTPRVTAPPAVWLTPTLSVPTRTSIGPAKVLVFRLVVPVELIVSGPDRPDRLPERVLVPLAAISPLVPVMALEIALVPNRTPGLPPNA